MVREMWRSQNKDVKVIYPALAAKYGKGESMTDEKPQIAFIPGDDEPECNHGVPWSMRCEECWPIESEFVDPRD